MTQRSRRAEALLDVLRDRPIAYHPKLVKPLGGTNETVFVCQLLYWDGKGSTPGGWIYKTQGEWEEETGLTRSNQETVRRHLRELGVLQEQLRGVPARLYYRLDFGRLGELVLLAYPDEERDAEPAQFAETPQTRLREPCKLDCDNPADIDCGNPANKPAETPQAISETSSETTREGGAERSNPSLQEIWHSCLAELRMQMTNNAYATNYAGSQLIGLDPQTHIATLAVRDDYVAQWVQARLAPQVLRVLGPIAGMEPGEMHLVCTVRAQTPKKSVGPPVASEPARPPTANHQAETRF